MIWVCQGWVGLENLGNTCYLNASLQALLHTQPLVKYFLGKAHLKDVNINSRYEDGTYSANFVRKYGW